VANNKLELCKGKKIILGAGIVIPQPFLLFIVYWISIDTDIVRDMSHTAMLVE